MTIYESLIQEHFNLSDMTTLNVLTSINEADQNKVLESLTSKLYDSIMNKATEIDFGTIPLSKGDITKMQGYEEICSCLEIMEQILREYKQDVRSLDLVGTVKTAIANVIERVDMFTKAFAMKIDLPVLTYNSICMAIVASTSLLITTSIEFIKDSTSGDYAVKFDKVAYAKNKDALLFRNLEAFNKSCQDKSFDKAMNYVIEQASSNLLGTVGIGVAGAIGGTIGILLLLRSIIPFLRELIFFFFYTKQSISDYFAIQADLLQINAEYVANNPLNGKTDKERREIAKKQNKVVDKFRKASNAFEVEVKSADNKAVKASKAESKKYNINEVEPPHLDSYDSDSSIF